MDRDLESGILKLEAPDPTFQNLKPNNMRPYEKLEAWQKSMLLVKSIYEVSQGFPKEEMFGLTQQMRRAAVSIPSNIAEGSGRSGNKEYAHFISIARGSLAELETQYKNVQMLNYCGSSDKIDENINHLGKKWNSG